MDRQKQQVLLSLIKGVDAGVGALISATALLKQSEEPSTERLLEKEVILPLTSIQFIIDKIWQHLQELLQKEE